MDMSQPYLPLSHALNTSSTRDTPFVYHPRVPHEDDDEDEGAVEKQLTAHDRSGMTPSPDPRHPTSSDNSKRRRPSQPKVTCFLLKPYHILIDTS